MGEWDKILNGRNDGMSRKTNILLATRRYIISCVNTNAYSLVIIHRLSTGGWAKIEIFFHRVFSVQHIPYDNDFPI